MEYISQLQALVIAREGECDSTLSLLKTQAQFKDFKIYRVPGVSEPKWFVDLKEKTISKDIAALSGGRSGLFDLGDMNA